MKLAKMTIDIEEKIASHIEYWMLNTMDMDSEDIQFDRSLTDHGITSIEIASLLFKLKEEYSIDLRMSMTLMNIPINEVIGQLTKSMNAKKVEMA